MLHYKVEPRPGRGIHRSKEEKQKAKPAEPQNDKRNLSIANRVWQVFRRSSTEAREPPGCKDTDEECGKNRQKKHFWNSGVFGTVKVDRLQSMVHERRRGEGEHDHHNDRFPVRAHEVNGA